MGTAIVRNGRGFPAAPHTVAALAATRPQGGVPSDLEELRAYSTFTPCFAAARAAGLRSVPHAGKSVGASEVYAALDFVRRAHRPRHRHPGQ